MALKIQSDHVKLMGVLKSGYPVHQDWAEMAADTIERLTKEVELLTKERVIFTARSRTVSMDEAREMFPDSEAKPPASD